MFEDSLFASTARRNRRRGWAAALSFAVQAVVLGVFVLIPLLYTDALPVSALKGVFVVTAPIAHAPAPKAPEPRHTRESASNYENNELVQPIRIPIRTVPIVDTRPVETAGDYSGIDIPGAIRIPGNTSDSMRRMLAVLPQPKPPANITAPRAVKLSTGITEGMLIRKVTPPYPVLAKAAGIQGQVMLQATIGHDGAIENLQVISGHPMLVRAALEAVKQWRYRPYLLNNQPVDVETQIIVNFTLAR